MTGTRRPSRHTLRHLAAFAALVLFVIGIAAVRLVYGEAGWVLFTLAAVASAYLAGSRHAGQRVTASARAHLSAQRAAQAPAVTIPGAPPVQAVTVVHDPPAQMAAAGLGGLGWGIQEARNGAAAAAVALRLEGADPDHAAILRRALQDAAPPRRPLRS